MKYGGKAKAFPPSLFYMLISTDTHLPPYSFSLSSVGCVKPAYNVYLPLLTALTPLSSTVSNALSGILMLIVLLSPSNRETRSNAQRL